MHSALVVIDVQESFRQLPIWQAASTPDLTVPVNRLVDLSRSRGDLVIWVLHTEPGTGNAFDPAEGHVRLMDGLVPDPGEPVLTKTSHNAFTTTNLQQILTFQGIRALTVCGIRTEQCCETTTRVGSDLGFDVTFAIDATATTPLPHWSAPPDRTVAEILADPMTLPTDVVISRTEYVLAGRFATIRTVAELTSVTVA